MAAVTVHSDFGAQENSIFLTFLPICCLANPILPLLPEHMLLNSNQILTPLIKALASWLRIIEILGPELARCSSPLQLCLILLCILELAIKPNKHFDSLC